MALPTDSDPGNPAYYEALGRAVRVLRTEQGLERKDLAERSGLSYAYLSEIETGKKRASSKALFAIAEALGLRPHEVLAVADRYAGATPSDPALSTVVLEASRSTPPPPSPPAPAAAPMAAPAEWPSQPQHAPRWRLFRPEAETAAPASASLAPPPLAAPAGAGPAGRPIPSRGRNDRTARNEAIRHLLAAADRLADDDLASLLDLARRLAR